MVFAGEAAALGDERVQACNRRAFRAERADVHDLRAAAFRELLEAEQVEGGQLFFAARLGERGRDEVSGFRSFLTMNFARYDTENNASTASAYAGDVFGSPRPSIIRKRNAGTSTSTGSLADAWYKCRSSFFKSIFCMIHAPC